MPMGLRTFSYIQVSYGCFVTSERSTCEIVVPPPEYSNLCPGSNMLRTAGVKEGFFPSSTSYTDGMGPFMSWPGKPCTLSPAWCESKCVRVIFFPWVAESYGNFQDTRYSLIS